MYFDNAALEDVVTELLQHLCLGCMHDVAEIHVIFHFAFKGYFY